MCTNTNLPERNTLWQAAHREGGTVIHSFSYHLILKVETQVLLSKSFVLFYTAVLCFITNFTFELVVATHVIMSFKALIFYY